LRHNEREEEEEDRFFTTHSRMAFPFVKSESPKVANFRFLKEALETVLLWFI